ncbi:MAG TPA: hypothetical protein VK438_00835 [Xanthobacteraceae bacterium]|nr:hypothetical protein [Xanthobacteraceae bacterium]
MHLHLMFRLALLAASMLIGISAAAFAQSTADPEKPVTAPDSYRVVMENERVRIMEIHIRAHSKIEVDSPQNRERFLYMLSDGALILAPPGKTPYEFALHAGETAVFPAVSQTVENDTDTPVRALLVEVKEADRTVVASRPKGRLRIGHGAHGKLAVRQGGKPKGTKSAASKSKGARIKRLAKAKSKVVKPPLNLIKAATRPAKKKVTGKSRASDG